MTKIRNTLGKADSRIENLYQINQIKSRIDKTN